MILVKHYQNQKRKSRKNQRKSYKILKKLLNLFGDLQFMTNYLSSDTNRRVLAQLVEKWQAVKDSYFQEQKKIKN